MDQRKRTVRSQTIALNRLPKSSPLRLVVLSEPHWRPQTRADCENSERPCPYVSCRMHMYLDVNSRGNIKLNFPDLEVSELTETCALDVAEDGEQTMERVGELMNLTRERVRQLIELALGKASGDFAELLR